MLGWALKRGIQGATGVRDAPREEGDTTLIEAPDTPAPIFAARAIKHAIFGTPAPPKETTLGLTRDAADSKIEDAMLADSRSPTKPAGILLTPGTATARRKRVSFDHDVKAGTNGEPQLLATNATGASSRKKSLQQRLEESRSNKSKKSADELKSLATTQQAEPTEEASDEEWEDDACSHDVTVDLNEPHSRSGRYWKSEFNKYSGDARTEMEKLVKYKHLAKCYAQKKDAETVELNQRLQEEHEKVEQLEERIASMSSQTGNKGERRSEIEDTALINKLAEKNTLVKEYRDRIKELESLLSDQGFSGGKSQHERLNASPRTEKTLLETSRELRRARNELKEMKRLREENERLRTNLTSDEQKATKLEENKHVAEDSSQTSRVHRLEKQLQDCTDEAQRKNDELKRVKKEFDTLKENAKTSRRQALQVLKEKNDRITELQNELRSRLDSDSTKSHNKGLDIALAQHRKITRDMKSDVLSLSKPSLHEKAKLGHPKRSMSAEDLTLDFTQQSFFDSPARKLNDHHLPPDWTDSITDIEEQLKQERRQRMEARKRDRDMVTEHFDVPPSNSLEKGHVSKTSQAPSGSRRVMSERINEAAARDRNQRGPVPRTATDSSDRALMHGALDNITNSRHTSKSHPARPPSPEFEKPSFDLLQNRFAKLGGLNPNDTALTANASRCTLPADRQAAARARLERKRRERQRSSDKENVRP